MDKTDPMYFTYTDILYLESLLRKELIDRKKEMTEKEASYIEELKMKIRNHFYEHHCY